MSSIKLFIPWIAYNHTVNMEHSLSMMRFLLFCQSNGVQVSLYPIGFESLVSRARNAAVAAFMSDPDATHLLFIDADIQFTPNDVVSLLSADKPIVCGAYAKKYLDIPKLCANGGKLELATSPSVHLAAATDPAAPPTALMKATYATTGFLCIKRSAIADMIQRFPERKYVNDIDAHYSLNPDYFYDLFPVSINPETRRYESEDYGFSRLATEAGIPIYCATDITLTHYGQMGFPCNLFSQLSAALKP